MGPVLGNVRVEKMTKTHTGLCTECALSNGCTFPVRENKKVVHCGEFVPQPPVAIKINDNNLQAALKSWSPKPENMQSSLKGLCSDCIAAATCTFPRSEGGIWNCDEYREK